MNIVLRGLCPLLQVFDMPASLRFYRDVLGFAEVDKSGEGDSVDWAWLPKVAPYGMRQLYFSDPDGYLICFQHPVK